MAIILASNMNHQDFAAKAAQYYADQYAIEAKRFGILAVADSFVKHGTDTILSKNWGVGIGKLWMDISRKSGLYFVVDSPDGHNVFAILSRLEVPHPVQIYELWELAEVLNSSGDDEFPLEEKLGRVVSYEGIYAMEVPAEISEKFEM